MKLSTYDRSELLRVRDAGLNVMKEQNNMLIAAAVFMFYIIVVAFCGFIEKGGLWSVSNWPGTLSFPVRTVRKGFHNIARIRYNVWFNGPDGHIWYGVTIGEYTQVCHCKRTKERICQ